jgi:protease I
MWRVPSSATNDTREHKENPLSGITRTVGSQPLDLRMATNDQPRRSSYLFELKSNLINNFIKEKKTMANNLEGKKIAILVTDGFEQSELLQPRQALQQAGAQTQLVSPNQGRVKGWNHKDWGEEVNVDVALKSANPAEFDALLLPGGVMNPDQLRMNPDAVQFVKKFVDAGKPVAAICHGPWMLVETDAVRGRTVTSWPSLKTDIRNAGGSWVDKEVVRDQQLVTSRKPDDIPAFNREMIALFSEGAVTGREEKKKVA